MCVGGLSLEVLGQDWGEEPKMMSRIPAWRMRYTVGWSLGGGPSLVLRKGVGALSGSKHGEGGI